MNEQNRAYLDKIDRAAAAIEAAWGQQARRCARYAFHKTAEGFDPAALARFAAALPPGYGLRPMGREEYRQALASGWGARDLCAQFADERDYCRRGLGVAVLQEGRLVAGASSYTVYRGGIEIEIDTHPDHRRRGLARACGAALMLECLKRGLYPSWDAQNPPPRPWQRAGATGLTGNTRSTRCGRERAGGPFAKTSCPARGRPVVK